MQQLRRLLAVVAFGSKADAFLPPTASPSIGGNALLYSREIIMSNTAVHTVDWVIVLLFTLKQTYPPTVRTILHYLLPTIFHDSCLCIRTCIHAGNVERFLFHKLPSLGH